jgi:hypothetical protein
METPEAACPSPQQPVNGETLQKAITWAVDADLFTHSKVHGNTRWQAIDLILLAVVWVWSDDATLTGAFAQAKHCSQQVLGRVALTTFQGFLKALVTWTPQLLARIRLSLHHRMEQCGGEHYRHGRWLPLAVDGSRIRVPRTKENEAAFCAPNYGHSPTARCRQRNKRKQKGRTSPKKRKKKPQPVKPQIWLTLLWHMGLSMPWTWRSGPSYSSEREHFRSLLAEETFPENTLFCADAGFVGYDLWKQLCDLGQWFVIRVGGNVTLLRRLGYVEEGPGVVYYWPDKVARQKQPPLVLRLLSVRVGACRMWLLTNVLDEEHLSEDEVARFYQLRWGVELGFRTLKQTFGRRKLRSKTPARALVELDWSLLGLWLVQLFAVKEQVAVGSVPTQCSVSVAIRVVRTMIHRSSEHSPLSFAEELRAAVKDRYKRRSSKKARYRPEYKDKPKAGRPKVLNATQGHKKRLKKLCKNAA